MEPSAKSSTLPVGCSQSAEVTTAWTPGATSALLVSMDLIRAWAWGLRNIFPCKSPGRIISAPYFACPVTLSAPSWRIGLVPTTL